MSVPPDTRWWKPIALLLAGALLVSACGQKGPLYLPDTPPHKGTPAHDKQP